MDSRNDLPPPGFEGPLGICRGVAPHPPCSIFVTLLPTDTVAWLSSALQWAHGT